MLENEILLRDVHLADRGSFLLMKSKFIAEGKNYARAGRCDNGDYGAVQVVLETPHEWQAHILAPKTAIDENILTIKKIKRYEKVIAVVPHFYIAYVDVSTKINGEDVRSINVKHDAAASSMWYGRSIFSLFKNMREWSFMVEEPFNSDHPMALYSKMAMDFLNPSQEILDEIDAMPDMHLAKFLKGRDDYRDIPLPFPSASQAFKDWVLYLSEEYKDKPFEEVSF
jgi:hypothetical protein